MPYQSLIFSVPFARLGLIISLLLVAVTGTAQKVNVIYIMADDLGYADLSIYGRKDYQTPNLDRLAATGMRFTNAYAAAAVCTPTRAAFMTGRYPGRASIGLLEPWTTTTRDLAIGLSASDFSMARAVRNAGYETALIGKWHLGSDTSFAPRKHGFDYFFGIKTGAADYISHRGDGGKPDLFENETAVDTSGYLTELLGAKALEFLERRRTKPFFLSLQFTSPHWPWQAPGDKPVADSLFTSARGLQSKGSPAIFAAMIKSLDDQVGRIILLLKKKGLDKNTLIIFTSDNGGERFSDMGPLSKSKMNVWEGGIRVPAFVSWPGKIEPNVVSGQTVITMDWSATILAVTGGKSDPAYPLDGIDLLPFLSDKTKQTDRTLYWRLTQRTKQHAVLEGRWKYVKDGNTEHLFDLSQDPGEKNDLQTKEPAKLSELRKKYGEWDKTMLSPIAL